MSECSKVRFFKNRCQNDGFLSIFDNLYKTMIYARFTTLEMKLRASCAENKGFRDSLCINESHTAGVSGPTIFFLARETRANLSKSSLSGPFRQELGLQVIEELRTQLRRLPSIHRRATQKTALDSALSCCLQALGSEPGSVAKQGFRESVRQATGVEHEFE